MVTLLHHIQPWMQRSITQVEECLERKMAQHIGRKMAEVHQRLDDFELWVLERLSSLVDGSTLQAAVVSLLADIQMIQEARVPMYEATSAEPIEDTMLAALFFQF